LESQEVNLDTFDESLVNFLLPRDDAAQPGLWAKLFDSPMLVTDAELESMFSLHICTRETPKPTTAKSSITSGR